MNMWFKKFKFLMEIVVERREEAQSDERVWSKEIAVKIPL